TGPSCNRAFSGLGRAAELMVAEWEMVDHGCLGSSQKCEWSVPLFVRGVIARARDAERDAERHHKVCSSLVGEHFSPAISAADRTADNQICRLNGRVKASLNATATMFGGVSETLVDGYVVADSAGAAGGTFDGHLTVGGNEIYAPSGPESLAHPIHIAKVEHGK